MQDYLLRIESALRDRILYLYQLVVRLQSTKLKFLLDRIEKMLLLRKKLRPNADASFVWSITLGCFLFLGCSLLLGCSQNSGTKKSEPNQFEPVPAENLTELQQKQKGIGIEAKDKLFKGLLAELSKSLNEAGASKSIEVCKEVAPRIAKEVSDETGVRIGRTSFKLRNPANQPPAWATESIQNKASKQVFVDLPENTFGMLLPIRLQDKCLLCHGSKEQISAGVQAALIRHYPKDQATGFSVGDIRGYFWIEVPANLVKN